MRRLRARRVDSHDGEIHFVIEEQQVSENSKYFKDYDMTKIKEISRKEATKPIVLFREE